MAPKVKTGKTLADCFAESPLFPSMVRQMVAAGEASGNIGAMIKKVSDYYKEELEQQIAVLVKILPVIAYFALAAAVIAIALIGYLGLQFIPVLLN